MEDPGPNVLEQIVKSNELLAAILAASGGAVAPAAGSPGLSGGGRCQWPTLFAWSNGTVHPFIIGAGSSGTATVSSLQATFLSHDSAIKVTAATGTGQWTKLELGPPMGPLLSPRLQFAWNSKHWPIQCYLNAELWYDNGVNLLKAGIQANENGQVFSYLNNVGAYVPLSTLDFDWKVTDWRKLDLSINFADSLYSRVGIDGNEFDLSAVAVQSIATTGIKHLYLKFLLMNNSATDPNECYLDEILITDGLYTGPPA